VVLEIQVGDVVRCRAPGEALYFEGLVVEDYHDGNYMVDFGADQSTESVNIKDMRKVSPAHARLFSDPPVSVLVRHVVLMPYVLPMCGGRRSCRGTSSSCTTTCR
jgi:hypothetical protein